MFAGYQNTTQHRYSKQQNRRRAPLEKLTAFLKPSNPTFSLIRHSFVPLML